MTNEEYAVAAQRTLSDQYHPKLVEHDALEIALSDFIAAAVRLDAFKKAAFYGKGDEVKTPLVFTGNKNYLHALLGICSEAGELAMNSINGLNGKPIDFVNTVEELGDLLWFIQLGCKSMGFSMAEIMTMNIDKLKARYPDKFTESNALERDVDAEMKAMMGDKPFDV